MADEVFLGFAEEFEDEEDLAEEKEEEEFPTRRFNVSKIGGKPVWLSPHLPDTDIITCPQCLHVMPLLLQIYAPLDVHEDSYHRILYVFCCADGRCHQYYTSRKRQSLCYVVLRSQLPKNSKLLPKDGAQEEEEQGKRVEAKGKEKEEDKGKGRCNVCGNFAKNRCGKCKKVYYCSKHHQLLDWKADHKSLCQNKNKQNLNLVEEWRTKEGRETLEGNGTIFPEFEIVTEGEEELREETEKDLRAEDEELIAKYAPGGSKQTEGAEGAVVPVKKTKKKGEKDWEEVEQEQKEKTDETFNKFQKRMRIAPDQVLRYGGKKVLWVQNEHQKEGEGEGGKCEKCGGKRRFEFQVLPQLLAVLKVESVGKKLCSSEPEMAWIKYILDWGTLVCYTCEGSCRVEKEETENEEKENDEDEERRDDYVVEGLWVQPNIEIDKNRPTPSTQY